MMQQLDLFADASRWPKRPYCSDDKRVNDFAAEQQDSHAAVRIEQVRLDNQRGARLAEVALQGNGHEIAAFHSSSDHPPSLHFC